jgi:AmiR/NasT family two-component response regulator
METKAEALHILAPTLDWPPEAVSAVERLLRRVVDLRRENEQLRTALESRVVIEQAKGVLAERHLLVPDQAFEIMRGAARADGRRLHDLAEEVVRDTATPRGILRQLEQGHASR